MRQFYPFLYFVKNGSPLQGQSPQRSWEFPPQILKACADRLRKQSSLHQSYLLHFGREAFSQAKPAFHRGYQRPLDHMPYGRRKHRKSAFNFCTSIGMWAMLCAPSIKTLAPFCMRMFDDLFNGVERPCGIGDMSQADNFCAIGEKFFKFFKNKLPAIIDGNRFEVCPFLFANQLPWDNIGMVFHRP